MENDLFISDNVQIRKKGENRYGKGKIRITDENIYLDFKKILTDPENYTIPRDKIEKTEVTKSGPNAEIIGPGYGAGYKTWWYILDIKVKEGDAFQMYIGQPWAMSKQMLDQITSDVKTITQILNPPGSNIQIPWEQVQ